MVRLSRFFHATLLTVLALGLFGSIALAEGENAKFSLRPVRHDPMRPATQAYFIYDAAVGQTLQDEVMVRNSGSEAGTVRLYAVDGTTGQTSGAVYLAQDNPRQDVGAWLQLAERELTLGPGEERKVAFTVAIPAGAAEGQHLGGLVAENTAAKKGAEKGALQINLQSRAVVAVQVNLPGPLVERITVSGVTPGGEQGHQTLLLGLRNDGTEMVKPEGLLTVTDAQAQEVQRRPLKLDTFVPRTAIQYPVFVERQALAAGQYRVRLELNYGKSGRTVYETEVTITAAQVAQVFQGRAPLAPPAAPAQTPPASESPAVAVAPLALGAASIVLLVLLGAVVIARRRRGGRRQETA